VFSMSSYHVNQPVISVLLKRTREKKFIRVINLEGFFLHLQPNGQKSISNIDFICNLSRSNLSANSGEYFYAVFFFLCCGIRKINIYQSAFVHNSHDCLVVLLVGH
jgi:hypothetical protein